MRGAAAGARATGREPAGPLEEGRDKNRKRGILQFLAPGEEREYMIEIGVLASNAEIKERAARITKV